MLGMASAAPRKALRLAERAQFVKDHPGWTFADYDAAAAGDIAFQREYERMRQEAERHALEKARQEADRAAEDKPTP